MCACNSDEISKANFGTIARPHCIHIEVPRVDYEKLSGNKISETSETIRTRVQAARNIQQTRFTKPNTKTSDIISNADMASEGSGNSVSYSLKVKA
jgi:predicted ATPase with chaperone activity